jgi:hypothetical protein
MYADLSMQADPLKEALESCMVRAAIVRFSWVTHRLAYMFPASDQSVRFGDKAFMRSGPRVPDYWRGIQSRFLRVAYPWSINSSVITSPASSSGVKRSACSCAVRAQIYSAWPRQDRPHDPGRFVGEGDGRIRTHLTSARGVTQAPHGD